MRQCYCSTLEEANEYYLRLCDKYDSVKLVKAPMFQESGLYVWEVSK